MSDLMISRRLQCRRRGGGRLKPLGKLRGTGIRQSTSQSIGGFANGYNAGRMDAEPKKGKWNRLVLGTEEYGTTVMYECSECFVGSISKSPFCPWCGIEMEGWNE